MDFHRRNCYWHRRCSIFIFLAFLNLSTTTYTNFTNNRCIVSYGDSLIIGTTGGIYVISIKEKNVKDEISVNQGIFYPVVKKIAVTDDGAIWILTEDNKLYVSYKKTTLCYPDFYLKMENGYDMKADGDRVFILTEIGLVIVDDKNTPLDFYNHNIIIKENTTTKIWTNVELSSKKIYIAGRNYLNIFDRNLNKIAEYKIDDINFIKSLYDTLYISLTKEILVLKDTIEEFLKIDDSIEKILDLEKIENTFYITAATSEIYRNFYLFNGDSLYKKALYYKNAYIPDPAVLYNIRDSILCIGGGRELYNDYGAGLYLYEVKTEKVETIEKKSIFSNSITAACSDRLGNLYFLHGKTGAQRGISMLENKSWYIFSYKNSPLQSMTPRSYAIDSTGRLIFGCWTYYEAIVVFDPYTYQWDYKIWDEEEKEKNVVSGVGVDDSNRIWIVNYLPNEITILSHDSLSTVTHFSLPLYYTHKLKVFKNRAFAITDEGIVVLKTHDLNNPIETMLKVEKELISTPYDVEKDIEGNFWVGTDKGIDVFDSSFTLINEFNRNNSPMKCDNIVGIEKDWKGRLWILSTESLYVYDGITDKWETVDSIISPSAIYNDLFIDKNNHIVIISSNNGATVIKDEQEENQNSNFIIYPNPVELTKNKGRVSIKNVEKGREIFLVSAKGKVIAKKIAESTETTLFFNNISPGLYMVVIKKGSETNKKPLLILK